jgi:cytochrome c oxidase assembly factor CtaG
MRPDPYGWSLHPEATAAVLVLVAAYTLAIHRFPAARWRIACFVAATLLLLAAAVSPIDPLSYHLLTIHLLQNVILAEWAPLLLVLAVPAALAGALARLRLLRELVRPPVALLLWLGTYYLWHVPLAYDTALEQPLLLHLEHATYLAAGVLLWWPAVQDAPWQMATGHRAFYILTAFVLGSPLGLLLALLPEAVYDYYADGNELWGLAPLTDQQIAGVTMASEQAVVFFAAFTFLFFRFLAEQEAEPVEP